MRRSSQRTIIQVNDEHVVFDLVPHDHALFVFLGSALAQVQVFETTVAVLLSATFKDQEIDFDELMRQHTSKTLGWLAKHLRTRASDVDLADVLDDAREKRNFLVHNILRKYGWWEMSHIAYMECMREIEGIRTSLVHAEREILKRLQDSTALGVLSASINAETGEISYL